MASALVLLTMFGGGRELPAASEYWKIDGTSGQWTSASWSSDGSWPYTTGWIAGSDAIFTGDSKVTYVTNTSVGNVTVGDGKTVTFTPGGTYSTGGEMRTLTVGANAVLDFGSQVISTATGTGFIKAGAGIFYSANTAGYPGGFTLNAGTVILPNGKAFGAGLLTFNGGTIAASTSVVVGARATGGITVGGDFTLGSVTTTPALAGRNGSAMANISFADKVFLGGATRKITISGNAIYTLSGVISGDSDVGLTVAATPGATGSLTLAGINRFAGATTINGGTLQLAADNGRALDQTRGVSVNGGTLLFSANNQIAPGAPITLGSANGSGNAFIVTTPGSGTSSQGDISTVGLGALTLAGSSTIDLRGENILHFGRSVTAAPGAILTINDWGGNAVRGGGASAVLFGSSNADLGYLNQIRFSNPTYLDPGTYYAVYADGDSGEIVPGQIMMVPEPGTALGGSLMVLILGFCRCRWLWPRLLRLLFLLLGLLHFLAVTVISFGHKKAGDRGGVYAQCPLPESAKTLRCARA